MNALLKTIIEHKHTEVAQRKKSFPIDRLPRRTIPLRSMRKSLLSNQPAIIAEVKRQSPSGGILRRDFDANAIAQQYYQNGAAAISVLTDNKFFGGTLNDLSQVSSSTPIPVLRKDFVIDPYQVYEAFAFGADAILLIAAALEKSQLLELYNVAVELGLDCVIELHNKDELSILSYIQSPIIGINNRNLSTLEVDLNTTIALLPEIPAGAVVVSESGIKSIDDFLFLFNHGIHAFLIGEYFMRAERPGELLHQLLHSVRKDIR